MLSCGQWTRHQVPAVREIFAWKCLYVPSLLPSIGSLILTCRPAEPWSKKPHKGFILGFHGIRTKGLLGFIYGVLIMAQLPLDLCSCRTSETRVPLTWGFLELAALLVRTALTFGVSHGTIAALAREVLSKETGRGTKS